MPTLPKFDYLAWLDTVACRWPSPPNISAVLIVCSFVSLSACGGGSSQPITAVPDPVDSGTGRFSLVGHTQAIPITEGANGISLLVSINRTDGHNAPVSLSIAASNTQSAENLSFAFTDDTLAGSQSATTLTMQLGVSMGPIAPQERTLSITATDGSITEQKALTLDVSPINAPDVYLLVGQSNMEGYSNEGAKITTAGGPDQPNPRILQLNVTGNNYDNFGDGTNFLDFASNFGTPHLVPAEDPLHDAYSEAIRGKGGTRIGLGLKFAKAALADTTQDIVLVPAAWAGTAFCANSVGNLAWNVAETTHPDLGGTKLFDRAVLRANTALSETGGILRGILWHQGESDATKASCANTYSDNLVKLVSALRTNIQPDARGVAARGPNASIPFIIGTMSRGGDYVVYDDIRTTIDNVHRSIENLIPYAAVSNHDDLVPPAYPCGQDSCIHFGAAAYRVMGSRYYHSLTNVLAR